MPCDSRSVGQTAEERQVETNAALAALERRLAAGQARAVVGPDGAIAFAGWEGAERAGVTDVCAFRALAGRDSWPLRQAVAAAEALAGRKLDAQAVATGRHSHDGGKSWHPGH